MVLAPFVEANNLQQSNVCCHIADFTCCILVVYISQKYIDKCMCIHKLLRSGIGIHLHDNSNLSSLLWGKYDTTAFSSNLDTNNNLEFNVDAANIKANWLDFPATVYSAVI